MKTIELKEICKTFNGKQVLNKVSLSVEEGEILGLLGPSGAGKTTILNILSGQLQQEEGTATLLGCDSTHLHDEIYQRIGLVLDTCGLYERLRVYDNLAMFAAINGVDKKEIPLVLESVGLQEALHKRVHTLSKGMKQRLVFARAILHHPKVLFLDEPTSGLDPATSQQIHHLILAMKKTGTTIFLTTHNMEEASKLCDHVALLNEGEIIEYGAPKALCEKYDQFNIFSIKLKDGTMQKLPNVAASAAQLAQLCEKEKIVSIHSSEPSLETVFIALTGRELL